MMNQYLPITDIYGREILDSRGNPTLEVEVLVGESLVARASVPSGASKGKYEAVELRDNDSRYSGKGVEKAADQINSRIAPELIGENVLAQSRIDGILRKIDGTGNKEVLGANAMLGVSMAVAKAGAAGVSLPLFRYLGGLEGRTLPIPMMNIVNGGKHAGNSLDFQEFMIMPIGACCFKESLRMGAEVYHKLKEVLHSRGLSTGVGDEGGFAPEISCAKEAFQLITEAVRKAGYEPGKDMVYGMDAAASELYNPDAGYYYFAGEPSSTCKKQKTAEELIGLYEELANEYPLVSIEDGLDQSDWEGWKELTVRLGNRVQLVGDDLFVTNKKRLKKGIAKGCGNAILIKPNQIGTVSETLETIRMAKEHGYKTIISHRSGETEDTFIADLAVAVNAGQIKTGAPCRSERVAKYNRLLRIEEEIGIDGKTLAIS